MDPFYTSPSSWFGQLFFNSLVPKLSTSIAFLKLLQGVLHFQRWWDLWKTHQPPTRNWTKWRCEKPSKSRVLRKIREIQHGIPEYPKNLKWNKKLVTRNSGTFSKSRKCCCSSTFHSWRMAWIWRSTYHMDRWHVNSCSSEFLLVSM